MRQTDDSKEVLLRLSAEEYAIFDAQIHPAAGQECQGVRQVNVYG